MAAFETRHHRILPANFRGFITQVGNGGAGLYYGVSELGEIDDDPWQEGGGFVGKLSEPFPHTGPWNDRSGMPEYYPEQSKDNPSMWAHCNRPGICLRAAWSGTIAS